MFLAPFFVSYFFVSLPEFVGASLFESGNLVDFNTSLKVLQFMVSYYTSSLSFVQSSLKYKIFISMFEV